MQTFSRRAAQKIGRLSEEERTRLVDELYSKLKAMEEVFQSLGEGLLVVSCEKDGFRLLMENNSAKRLIAHSSKNADCPIWEIVSDSAISDFLFKTISEKKTNVSDEFTVETASGAMRFLDVSIAPFELSSGNIGSIVRVDDVTEKRQQEILLHRMETMAGLTNIAANVAHEIKNPLGAISIHIQLMQKAIRKKRNGDGLLPEKKFAEDYLEVVSEEIERLNKIVVNFLMAVRPISAKLALVDANALVRSFVEFFKIEFKEKSILFETTLSEEPTRLLIDEKLFREVLVNLAQNAISAVLTRFSDGKGGKISISTKKSSDTFFLEFFDNGSGMDDQTLARIFEPYFTTKADGTGLGLAMVYKIIKEFRGDIRVESHLGEGTHFFITIPIPQTDKRLLPYKCGGKE